MKDEGKLILNSNKQEKENTMDTSTAWNSLTLSDQFGVILIILLFLIGMGILFGYIAHFLAMPLRIVKIEYKLDKIIKQLNEDRKK